MFYYIYRFSARRAKREGKKDGRLGASSKHYEESLVHAAEDQAHRIAKQWNKKDKKLKAKYCDALSRRDTSQANLTLSKDDMKRPKTNFEQEQENYKTTYTTHHSGALLYGATIFFIIFVDIFLNFTAFTAFALNAVFTFLLSLGASLAFAFFIHGLTILFAQNPFEKGRKNTFLMKALFIFLLIALTAYIVIFSMLRGQYSASLEKRFAALGIAIELTPTLTSVALGILGYFLAAVGIMAGHGRYEPKVSERRTALTTADKRFGLARGAVTRAERIHQKILKKFYTAESNRKNEFTLMRNDVERMNKTVQTLAKHYRMHYERMAKKKRPGEPVHFDSMPPASEMPEGLRELDESCAT